MMKKKKNEIEFYNMIKKISTSENEQNFCINFFNRELLYYQKVYSTIKTSHPCRFFKKKYQEWENLVKEL